MLFPAYLQPVSRFFRKRRNRRLVAIIDELFLIKDAAVDVLDIGGSLTFWLCVPESARAKCRISLINLPGSYGEVSPEAECIRDTTTLLTGDARDLSQFADSSFDLVVCNSVIEHVGAWPDMVAVAGEARRVGRRGWIQVPAFEFPVEQHYLLPFVHWFSDPIQVKVIALLHREFRKWSFNERYIMVHHVRPLTHTQLKHLFPDTSIRSEWVIFPKCHIAAW
jgi:hypothetical protein